MNTKHTLLALSTISLFAYVSCKKSKDPVVYPQNRTLVNIPLDELRSILSGNWLLKKELNCGVAGCFPTTYPTGQEDIFSFLQQDSVKRIKADGTVLVYDKAIITKSSSDSTWLYSMHGGLIGWSFQQIKNDTLVLNKGGGLGSMSYLVRKP